MLSPDAKRVLKFAKSENGNGDFREIEVRFNWKYEKAKSVCTQLVDEGFASWFYSHPLPGKEICSGISLSEKGRYSFRFFFAAVGEWFLDNLVAILALIIAILAYIKQ